MHATLLSIAVTLLNPISKVRISVSGCGLDRLGQSSVREVQSPFLSSTLGLTPLQQPATGPETCNRLQETRMRLKSDHASLGFVAARRYL